MSQAHEPHSSLFNDLNALVKVIKQREENHIILVQYIRKMSEPDTNQNVFLDEELRRHRGFIEDLYTKQHSLSQFDLKLNNKWAEYKPLDGQGVKLLYKSVARILEICQSTVQKIRMHQQLYDYEYRCFRESFIKYQTENNLIDLVQLINGYSVEKFQLDQTLLKRLIEMIENGQKETMRSVIEERYQKIRIKIEQQRIRLKRIKEQEIRMLRQRQREKEEERYRIQEKMKLALEAQKILIKNKKRVAKFSDAVLSKLYCPLVEFSRAQFAEDMVFADQRQQRQKLLRELKQRNKLVQSQINKFIGYSNNIDEKIKVLSQSKQERQANSSPKLNLNHRISTSRQRSVSNKKIEINYSSIETVSQLPPINQSKLKATPILKFNDTPIECYSHSQAGEKHALFIKSIASQKIQTQKHDRSPKPLQIFETIKFPTQRRKQSTLSQGLPQINIFQRVSLDANKARVILHTRNNPKVIQFSHKNKRRSETPQMLIPLIQISIPSKYSLKVSRQQNSQPTYNLKKLIKN